VEQQRSAGKHRRPLSPWLLGLILATLLFVIVLVVANALGFGDDPVIGSLASVGQR
jgi:hypothetical protein